MTDFVKVAILGDLPPDSAKCVDLAGEKVALFNVEGTVYAIANECPHIGGPLSEGDVEGTTIVCPWHGAEFDLATGEKQGPPADSDVKTYRVEVVGDEIRVAP